MSKSRFSTASLCLALFCLVAPASAASSVSSDPWPQLSDAQQKAALEQLKAYARDTEQRLDTPLQGFETHYFLFCSDLDPQETAQWAALLDRMYDRLAEMFAVPEGKNIWRGKALIFVFRKQETYRKYERDIAHTDPGTSAGMCHAFNDGTVKIAFYRQPDQLAFAHVLVHESVHGFLHRYRTPVPVPSWANEGLAETVATDLVPQKGRREMVRTLAEKNLRSHHDSLGDFFTTEHIAGWQYPVAEQLCTFMIQASSQNYVDFINGIKSGMNWSDALETRYKAPVDRLLAFFGQSINVPNLRQ